MSAESELPRLWDILTGGVGLGAMASAFASWGGQKQKLQDVEVRMDNTDKRLDKMDERSRLVERIDERTRLMQVQHDSLNAKMDQVLHAVRAGQFDKPR